MVMTVWASVLLTALKSRLQSRERGKISKKCNLLFAGSMYWIASLQRLTHFIKDAVIPISMLLRFSV